MCFLSYLKMFHQAAREDTIKFILILHYINLKIYERYIRTHSHNFSNVWFILFTHFYMLYIDYEDPPFAACLTTVEMCICIPNRPLILSIPCSYDKPISLHSISQDIYTDDKTPIQWWFVMLRVSIIITHSWLFV